MVTPRSIGGRANRRRARLEGFGDGTIENPLNLKEIKMGNLRTMRINEWVIKTLVQYFIYITKETNFLS